MDLIFDSSISDHWVYIINWPHNKFSLKKIGCSKLAELISLFRSFRREEKQSNLNAGVDLRRHGTSVLLILIRLIVLRNGQWFANTTREFLQICDGAPDVVQGEGKQDTPPEEGTYMVISEARVMVSMGKAHRSANSDVRNVFCVDAALIDTGCPIVFTAEKYLVPACLAASVQKTKVLKATSRNIIAMGWMMRTEGTLQLRFYFVGRIYQVAVNAVPGRITLIFSYRYLDNMVLNYHCLQKIIERLEYEYVKQVDWRSNLPYLVFTSYRHFSDEELHNIRRNLGIQHWNGRCR